MTNISSKDHIADALILDKDRLENQARFIQMIIDKKLSVSNRRKVEIVDELRQLNFRAFPKVAQAKKSGIKEPVTEDAGAIEVAEEEEENVATSDYDYLLGMAIWSLTREKVCAKDARDLFKFKMLNYLNVIDSTSPRASFRKGGRVVYPS